MKIKANIKYPPPKFEARQLEFDEAVKLIDALTKELVVTNSYITLLETMLEQCQAMIEAETGVSDQKAQLLIDQIKEVLK